MATKSQQQCFQEGKKGKYIDKSKIKLARPQACSKLSNLRALPIGQITNF